MKKKVCIVGYGAIGPVHADALQHVENAVLYAVCDIRADRRALCQKTYPAVAEYEDFDRMLADPTIDSVHICTPHYLHYEMTARALKAGKQVVVEKPVTMTGEEFHALKNLEGADKICMVLQNRLNPSIQKMKELTESGELGNIRCARGILTWHRDPSYYGQDRWRGRWATEGGGVLINQAVHTLDYFSYLVGKVESVRANKYNYTLENVIEVEDTFTASLQIQGGIGGMFFATNGYGVNSSPLFEIVYEKGTARYLDGQLWVNGQSVAKDTAPSLGKDYWGSGHARLLKQYYDEQKYFGMKDVENTMETMFAMYESAGLNGEPVAISK